MSSSHKSEISTEKLWAKDAKITDLHAKEIVVGESIVFRGDYHFDYDTITCQKWREMQNKLAEVTEQFTEATNKLAELQSKTDKMEQEFQAIKDQLASRTKTEAEFDSLAQSIVKATQKEVVVQSM